MNRRDVMLAAAGVPFVTITPVKTIKMYYVIDIPQKCVRKVTQTISTDKIGDKIITTTVGTRLGSLVHKSVNLLPEEQNISMIDKLINIDIFPQEVTVEPDSQSLLKTPNNRTFVIRNYNIVISPKELLDISNLLLRTNGVELS